MRTIFSSTSASYNDTAWPVLQSLARWPTLLQLMHQVDKDLHGLYLHLEHKFRPGVYFLSLMPAVHRPLPVFWPLIQLVVGFDCS
ncbi:hypothetical protein Tco_0103332 [Tanacetum coccineum]